MRGAARGDPDGGREQVRRRWQGSPPHDPAAGAVPRRPSRRAQGARGSLTHRPSLRPRPSAGSGHAPRPPADRPPLSPATAATSRSAAAHSPSKRSRGIAMLRFSSIAPAPPSSPQLPASRGLPPPAQAAAATAAKAPPGGCGDSQTSGCGSGRGDGQEAPPGVDGAGQPGRVRCGRCRRAVSPCRRAAAAQQHLRAGPYTRRSPIAAFSSRKWRSRAVTARCSPPLTSRL